MGARSAINLRLITNRQPAIESVLYRKNSPDRTEASPNRPVTASVLLLLGCCSENPDGGWRSAPPIPVCIGALPPSVTPSLLLGIDSERTDGAQRPPKGAAAAPINAVSEQRVEGYMAEWKGTRHQTRLPVY